MRKKSKNKILKIQDDNGITTVYPGDTYNLTLSVKAEMPALKGSTTITASYFWDGETLTRKFY